EIAIADEEIGPIGDPGERASEPGRQQQPCRTRHLAKPSQAPSCQHFRGSFHRFLRSALVGVDSLRAGHGGLGSAMGRLCGVFGAKLPGRTLCQGRRWARLPALLGRRSGDAAMTDVEKSFAINKARWSEVVEIHARAPFYRVAEFLR